MSRRDLCRARAAALGAGLAAAVALIACTPPRVPDDSAPPTVVRVDATQEWTDTGITVRKDDRLFLTATGEIYWDAHRASAGPDGIGGSPGWLNTGGLIGRVSSSPTIFDIGARMDPMPSPNLRSKTMHPPPPIRIPADGVLELGFKRYSAGANTGSFEVTIRHARQP